MKKKILSLVVALMFFINTISTVSATEISNTQLQKEALLSTINMSEEIGNALNDIIDESVPEDIMKQVDVGVQIIPNDLLHSKVENIDAMDIFDVKYTVKNVGNIVYEDDNTGTMYSLTAVATTKESSGENEVFGVECTITIVWIDKLGTNNEFVSVYGGWKANDRVLSDRQVYYGVWEDANPTSQFPTKNTFSYDVGYNGLAFEAYSWVSAEDYPYLINCYALTSILD
ncbi:MAG: hypothetical protein PHE29_06325 [Tissierellia bacterium]|nr:hypothetical protein [Tissierellia bacterium]MDD4781596.1 hypothetical protein [Tissierellia bacterium]